MERGACLPGLDGLFLFGFLADALPAGVQRAPRRLRSRTSQRSRSQASNASACTVYQIVRGAALRTAGQATGDMPCVPAISSNTGRDGCRKSFEG